MKTRIQRSGFRVEPAVAGAILAMLAVNPASVAQYPSAPDISKNGTSIQLVDYASLPLSSQTGSTYPPPINFGSYLGRANFLRSEPADAPLSATRFFVCDQNRNLYILDKSSRAFTNYINFEEVFRRFFNRIFGCGIVTFEFDPGYAGNGRFYTVHTETNKNAFYVPVNTSLPGLNTNGYTPTPLINPPGGVSISECVLVEWTDTNIVDSTFQGTARELLRVGYSTLNHPVGDLVFNPLTQPGHADYGNLYIIAGDDAAGQTSGSRHTIPQRLDVLLGKILRITPDINWRTNDVLSANGRYRIPSTGPDPNPFVSLSLANLKKEIYAYGFRNQHRLAWDAVSGKLIVTDIGYNSWEEVNFVVKGGNYGYAEREGMEQFFAANGGTTGSQMTPSVQFPNPDSLTVTGLLDSVTPLYPVAAYSHRDGDGISSGFVYRGSLMPALYGKYVFGDITCGRLFYCDLAEMIAADDTNHVTVATIHELQTVVNGVKRRVFDIVSAKYHEKGGTANALPGGCGLVTGGNDPEGVPYGCGRADIRIAQGGDGELYLLSKSDGMIRQFAAVLIPPTIQTVNVTNDVVTLNWPAISNRTYRVQFKTSLNATNWSDLPGDVTAIGATASKSDTSTDTRFYRLRVLP